ncbi:6,7-dimethyl-8-ribityllumazine synthase [Candidatus Parcubacteria bacterium]|nr:MAG: 6,7-dimethyl-8-ribityllumazine synthase [Candidatus Parcubacteria bacterium]
MNKVALIMGAFHKEKVEKMLQEARRVARENNLKIISEVWVPGSVEVPLAAKMLLQKDDVQGIALLGIIEKGSTKHGFVMGEALMKIVMELQIEFMKPVTMGILGPDIEDDQIEPRLLPYAKKAIVALAQMFEVKDFI